MAGDTGRKAPAGAGAPLGVLPGSEVGVTVRHGVGGGDAWLHLVRKRLGYGPDGERVPAPELDPAPGRDYVKYEFKLTGLAPGQVLPGSDVYSSSSNPEDSLNRLPACRPCRRTEKNRWTITRATGFFAARAARTSTSRSDSVRPDGK